MGRTLHGKLLCELTQGRFVDVHSHHDVVLNRYYGYQCVGEATAANPSSFGICKGYVGFDPCPYTMNLFVIKYDCQKAHDKEVHCTPTLRDWLSFHLRC